MTRRDKVAPLERHAPEEHALQLLYWISVEGGVIGEILAEELRNRYGEMLLWYGWAERPWNIVAARFRKLIGDRKRYKWVERDDRKHRLRVCNIPAISTLCPAPRPTPQPTPKSTVSAITGIDSKCSDVPSRTERLFV